MGKSRARVVILFLFITLHLGARDIDVAPGEWVPQHFVITPSTAQLIEEIPEVELDRSLYLLLLYDDIINATYQENIERAKMLAISEIASDALALQEQLLKAYGLTKLDAVDEIMSTNDLSRVEILQANTLAAGGREHQTIFLAGDVVLRLNDEGEQERMLLRGGTLVYERERQLLIGLGTIALSEAQADVERYLEGSGFYLSLENNDLLLSQGITEFVWTPSEEGEKKLFAQGERFFVPGDKSHLAVEMGVLSLQRELPHSSIGARQLNFVEGGDLLAKNVVISIGRVPVLYLPWLYYPGQRFIFNPVFGYDSIRGLFFASTTELYGQYPSLESQDQPSFSSLLTSFSGEQTERGEWTYQVKEVELSALELWARRSSSYLALLFDSYQNSGTFVGVDTLNNFGEGQHTLTLFGGLALPGSSAITSSSYTIPTIRYFLEPSYVYKGKNANLTLRLPLLSDPLVKRDFANRLTTLSLLGEQYFPTTYQSAQQTFNWELNASGKLNIKALSPYVETLQLSKLLLQAQWRAKRSSVGPGYQLEQLVLPEVQVRLGGTLFQFKGSKQSTSSGTRSSNSPFSIESHLLPYSLRAPYQVQPTSITIGPATNFASELSLRYQIQSFFSHSLSSLHTASPTKSLYSKVQSTFTFQASVGPNWLDLKGQLTPVFTFDESKKSSSGTLRVGYQQTSAFVKIGLKHTINLRLYSYDFVNNNSEPSEWNQSDILTHSLTWNYPIKINNWVIEMALEATLPPRNLLLQPALTISNGPAKVSLSHSFSQTDGHFLPDTLKLSLAYVLSRRFESQVNLTYKTLLAHSTNTFNLKPLNLAGWGQLYLFGTKLSLKQSFSYDGSSNEFDSLVTGLTLYNSTLQLSAKTTDLSLVPQSLDFSLKSGRFEKYWWKNRIALFVDASLSVKNSFVDKSLSTLAFNTKVGFLIAEFLELNIELSSVNKSLGSYDDISSMLTDLWRSFDFFGTGRLETYFDMEKVSLELIHFMPEWDLHCKYEGSVVLSDQEWRWSPSFTIFLQWKAIPEIKFDSRF